MNKASVNRFKKSKRNSIDYNGVRDSMDRKSVAGSVGTGGDSNDGEQPKSNNAKKKINY